MPDLKFLQSHWAMERLAPGRETPSMSECLMRIRDAGYDGISAHFHTRSEVESWIT